MKPIFIASSPNTQFDDFKLALKLLFSPSSWKNNKNVKVLEDNLSRYLNVKYSHAVDSGRSALYIILKSLGVKENDEVIVPSFTCLVVANAVRWTGAVPKYPDTNLDDFNTNLESLDALISDKTRAIVVQHTFGKKVDIEQIRKIIKNRKIFIIEDFAHTLKRNQSIEGDTAFLTFGIEKVISGVRGGAIITNDQNISENVQKYIQNLPTFPLKMSMVALTNPIFWYIATPLHGISYKTLSIGAILRWIFRKLGFLGNMIESVEHKGNKPDWLPAKISPALAKLANHQLSKLDFLNEHRSKIAKIYSENLSNISDGMFDQNRIYLRYPILLQDKSARNKIWKTAKSLKITLGDWYIVPLYSKYVDEKTYELNCFFPEKTPVTKDKCSRVLNLPTGINISESRAKILSEKIKYELGF